MNKALKIILPGLLLALALLAQQFYAKPQAASQLNCPSLSQGCSFNLGQQRYTIRSQQPLDASLPVILQLQGKAGEIHASWQMQGMDMGPNRYRLLSDDQQHWQAQTALPICTNKRQDWLLKLEIDGQAIEISTVSEKHA